jgi:hypothetical protein
VRGWREIFRARQRYESLLARHPLAFADHAAEFYRGVLPRTRRRCGARVGAGTAESRWSRDGPRRCARDQGRTGDWTSSRGTRSRCKSTGQSASIHDDQQWIAGAAAVMVTGALATGSYLGTMEPN